MTLPERQWASRQYKPMPGGIIPCFQEINTLIFKTGSQYCDSSAIFPGRAFVLIMFGISVSSPIQAMLLLLTESGFQGVPLWMD